MHDKNLLVFVVLAVTACGIPTAVEDNPLEKSAPAIEMAAEYQELDAPVAFQFEQGARPTSLPASAHFPRWYCPKSVVTRGQMASFVARTVQGPDGPLPIYDGRFSDVTGNNRHASSIAFVADAEISVGCAEGAFCPDDGVTRAQMALFTVRMMHGPDYILPPPSTRYADVDIHHTHAGAIEQLALDGIEVPCDQGNFCPDRPVTRDEIAAFLVPAKYRTTTPGRAPGVFSDVAGHNPHREAVNVIARDLVTTGCDAPNVGFRLHGEPITERQRDWLLYFAGRTLPRLSAAYQDSARAMTVGARVIWWSLKEGVFGHFDDPFRHSMCNGEYISPFDNCQGDWEVGLTAAIVPGDSEVHTAAQLLYPEYEVDELALETLEFGRVLSSARDAEYPDYATERVLGDPALRRSWLARDATIGAWLMVDAIERDCIERSEPWCTGTDTAPSRMYARDTAKARAVQNDLRRILVALRPR